MPFFDFLTLALFGFGLALNLILLSMALQKRVKQAGDIAFGVLFAASILWFGGNTLSLFSALLFGTVARPASISFSILAYIGIAILPSAFMHVYYMALQRAHDAFSNLSKRQKLFILSIYLPSLVFIGMYVISLLPPTQEYMLTRQVHALFIGWIIIALSITLVLSEKLISTVQEQADYHLYRDMSYVLYAIALAAILIFIAPLYKLPYIGVYLVLLMQISPAVPMGVFLYYVYRYNFYRLVLKPSLIYSIIYGFFMAVYLLVIRRLGEYLKTFPDVNAEFIEGLLLVAFVFAFQPLRSLFQSKLDRLFFKERMYYQEFLRELSDTISQIVDLEKLLQTIHDALTTSLHAKSCSIILFNQNENGIRIIRAIGRTDFQDFSQLVQAILATKNFRLRRQIRDRRIQNALGKNRLALVIPVYYSGKISGIICLEEKQSGNTYTDEELDVLQTFANQIGLAFENARLIQQRIDLEGKFYRSENLNALGRLTTTLSHEIKNPLSSIKAIVQVLHENATGEEKEDFELIIKEINRLHDILQKLLAFARPSGAEPEMLYLEEIIDHVLSLVKHQAEKQNIQLAKSYEPDLPAISGRRQTVQEILFNLIFNAIQAQNDGGSISVTLAKTKYLPESANLISKRSKTYLKLSIADQGPGIPQDLQKKIFKPFFTTKTRGTGLGLSIVKRNVEELGGWIEVVSKNGTTFTLYVPAYHG